MQNSFLHPEGSLYGGGFFPGKNHALINISETIEANRILIDFARSSSIPVICTLHCYRPGYTDAPGSQPGSLHVPLSGRATVREPGYRNHRRDRRRPGHHRH